MSESPTRDLRSPADPQLAEALGRVLEAGDPLSALAALPAGDAAELRPYVEAWAALGTADVVHPSPALRDRIFASVGANPAAGATGIPPRTGGVARWALAAALVLTLAGVSAWQGWRLTAQGRQIVDLQEQVRELVARAPSPALHAEMAAMQAQLRVVSMPGVAACSLKARARKAAAAGRGAEVEAPQEPRGVLYVAADHQHWFLALTDVPPAPEGHRYHLWFFVDGQPVAAGPIPVGDGEVVRLGSDTMPGGTSAVAITLETEPGGTTPSQEPFLFGDELKPVA